MKPETRSKKIGNATDSEGGKEMETVARDLFPLCSQ